MEKLKIYWKPFFKGLSATAFTVVCYMFYQKYKGKFKLPFGKNSIIPLPLTKDEAMHRSSLVKNLKYTLFLQLKSDKIISIKNTYDGSILIEFDLNKIEDIFLDFKGEIKKIYVNSILVKTDHRNERIYIKKDTLLQNGNKIQIQYLNNYTTSSPGIRHYIDPNDLVIF